MGLQVNNNVVVSDNFPVQREDASSNYANFMLLNNLSETEHTVLPYIQKYLNTINLNELISLKLIKPIKIIVEYDEVHFLAECIELPIYAIGHTRSKAIHNLKEQIEELFLEIEQDDNLSEDWLKYKSYLIERIK